MQNWNPRETLKKYINFKTVLYKGTFGLVPNLDNSFYRFCHFLASDDLVSVLNVLHLQLNLHLRHIYLFIVCSSYLTSKEDMSTRQSLGQKLTEPRNVPDILRHMIQCREIDLCTIIICICTINCKLSW